MAGGTHQAAPDSVRDISVLPTLRTAANGLAKRLDFGRTLAEITYAICALDATDLDSRLRLGRALATLGDRDGTPEVFRLAGQLAVTDDDRRGVLLAFVRAKVLLDAAPAAPGCTLESLRARGWAGVSAAVTSAQSLASDRPCPKCEGWGYFAWFHEHDNGVCYECNGTGQRA